MIYHLSTPITVHHSQIIQQIQPKKKLTFFNKKKEVLQNPTTLFQNKNKTKQMDKVKLAQSHFVPFSFS